jgi:NADPH-dependent 7-cyano-7-deazaguanine reductase QueF
VKAADPERAAVDGDFAARGGIATHVTATYQRKKK